MKTFGITAMIMTALFFASCGSVTNVSTSNQSASNAGINCGKVLASLYSQYKATGKLDMTNSTNFMNVVSLATYYKTLKAHANDASYKTSFAAGMVTGSNGTITAANSLTIVNKLLSMSGLGGITSSTANTATELLNVVNQLVGLFKLFV
jgi:hypothetical protein